MAAVSRPLGGQVISIGSTRGESTSGNIVRRSEIGPGQAHAALGAVFQADRSAYIAPPDSRNKPSGFNMAVAGPPRVRQATVGVVLRRSELGEPDTH